MTTIYLLPERRQRYGVNIYSMEVIDEIKEHLSRVVLILATQKVKFLLTA